MSAQLFLTADNRNALFSAISEAQRLLQEDQSFGYHNQEHGYEVAYASQHLALQFYDTSEDFLQVVYYAGLCHDLCYRGSSNFLKKSGSADLFPEWVQQLLPPWETMEFPAEDVSARIAVYLLRKNGFGDGEVIERVSHAIMMTAVPKSIALRADVDGGDPLAVVLTAADLWESVSDPLQTMQGILKLYQEHDQEAIQKGLVSFWEEYHENGMTSEALSLLAKSTFGFFGFVVAPDGNWKGGTDFAKAGHPVFAATAQKTFATIQAIATNPQDYPEMVEHFEALLANC
jgi:hypothetical protein